MSNATFTQLQQSAASYQGAILGQLAWYSIPEETVAHDTVLQLCKTHGLEAYAPAAPRPPDVFRRACKTSSRRIGAKDAPQRFSYEFKSIDHDHNSILVKLVRETVDAATNKGIDWVRQANITFKRDTHVIDVVELPDIDDTGRDVIVAMKQVFADENGRVNSAHIRRMIQDVLHKCMATAVRPSGGIYFVTEANADDLTNVCNVVNALPSGSSMHLLPLVDTADQRHMLQHAVEAEVTEEIDRHVAAMTEVLKSGNKITADQFTRMTAELHRAGRKGNEYTKLLSRSLTQFESRKHVAADVVSQLANLVEVA